MWKQVHLLVSYWLGSTSVTTGLCKVRVLQCFLWKYTLAHMKSKAEVLTLCFLFSFFLLLLISFGRVCVSVRLSECEEMIRPLIVYRKLKMQNIKIINVNCLINKLACAVCNRCTDSWFSRILILRDMIKRMKMTCVKAQMGRNVQKTLLNGWWQFPEANTHRGDLIFHVETLDKSGYEWSFW